jgi:glycine cleavage system aminomethyltransferase T
MCSLTVEDHTGPDGVERYMLGGEPVLTADGEPLVDGRGRRSYVTTAGSAPTLGKHVLMAYLPPDQARVGNRLSVEYLGHRYPVVVGSADSTPLFDPDNERIRR